MAELERIYKDTDTGGWGWVTQEATGGGGSGEDLPQAAPDGATVDDTTYDNFITGSGKLTVLVLPEDTPFLAVAIVGDAFPRWVMTADPTNGIFLGDGTAEPGAEIDLSPAGDGTHFELAMNGTFGGAALGAGRFGASRGFHNRSSKGMSFNNAGMITSEEGDPNGQFGGQVGDLYIRIDGGDGTWLYRCTVAGDAAGATWVAKV